MNLVLCCLLLMGNPVEKSKWKVSYSPDNAVLMSDGTSLLFHKKEVYLYDTNGNLDRNFTLDFVPETILLDQMNTLWVHDGAQSLIRLSEQHKQVWKKNIGPPSLTPFSFENMMVYVVDNHIQVLDPADGNARYSHRHSSKVTALHQHEKQLLIADEKGSLLNWTPRSGKTEILVHPTDQALHFVLPDHDQTWALVYDQGFLQVLKSDFKKTWTRNFHIDVPIAPLWLQGNKKQLLITNQGRRIFAFGPRGEQLATKLIKGRPKAMIPFGETQCLIVPGFINELIWYNANDQQFAVEQINNYPVLSVENGTYVMVIDKDDIIRLYMRDQF